VGAVSERALEGARRLTGRGWIVAIGIVLALSGALVTVRVRTIARERRVARARDAAAEADGLIEETLAIPAARLPAIAGRQIQVSPAGPSLLRVRAIVAYDGGEATAEMIRTTR
jgi:hypothetical protein